ncbi:diguanylate cyclase [Sphingobium sp. 10 DY56-G10]|uniref:diguanylate cyclase domain-containing protein n=1 Tax=Sphingomonadales TaxID=204457 RepID=UPI0000D7B715|nr:MULTISPECIES: diguanylate cyclase [Sphingomonadaceae]EAT10265.1 sensory box/GGDEF family protein [Sphingomonas sp. SKA58]
MHQTLEDARLRKLASFHILDTPPERDFDALTALARRLLDCPIALVSLVDQDRQWFKSAQGLGQVRETPRDQAFCAHTIHQDNLLVIEDASADPRFARNPLVVGKPHIRFYAGVPLRPHHDGHSDMLPGLGSLCVIDTQPRALSDEERDILRDLAAVAESLLRAHATAQDARYLAELAEERADILDGQHRLLRQAEKLAGVGSWRVSLDDGVVQWSDQVYAIHGLPIGSTPPLEEALAFYSPEEARLIEKRLRKAMRTGEGFDFETDLIAADGRMRRVRSIGEVEFRHDRPAAIVGVFQDVTERHLREEELRHSASTDSLSGLSNRASFEKRLGETLARLKRRAEPVALLLIDLDGFKAVNDSFGHAAGDDILRAMAARMREGCMANAFAARLGGDEFALLVTRPRDCADLESYVQRVLDQLQVSITQDGQTRRVSATVGATLADGPGVTQLDLMRRADLALYQAKRHMRGTGRIFGSDAPIIRDGVALS